MIKKILSIKGVGKYVHFSANDMKINSFFEKLNVIYANNGRGKTTLSAILKSLQTGNSKILIDRKSINYPGKQEVSILATAKHNFKDKVWNAPLNELEIFDTFFIDENVFSGFETSLEHKKNLHQFVLGEKAVLLANDIREIKQNISQEQDKLKTLEQRIVIKNNSFSLSGYLKLLPSDDIQERIDNKRKELELAKKKKEIERANLYKLIPNIKLNINIDECKYIIGARIEDIEKKYIEKVQAHLKFLRGNGLNSPEKWIREGFTLVDKGESCPFCNQKIKDNENLIIPYRQFFNQEYNILKNKCEKALEKFKRFNLMLELEKLQATMNINQELANFWNPLVNEEVAVTLDLNTEINTIYLRAQSDLNDKLSNLFSEMQVENFDLLDKELDSINNVINEVNRQLELGNTYIHHLKGNSKDVLILEMELSKVEDENRRFQEPYLSYCADYININEKIKELRRENRELQNELKEYSRETFEKYGNKINEYLKAFSTKFEIKDLQSYIIGRSNNPAVRYVLTLDGKEITFDNKGGKVQASHALSDGDRSTLALAFFLAKLDIDKNIDEKIIVFDDPLSSLDSNRRNKTVNLLIEKSKRAKQTFILSHNDSFIFKLYEKASPKMMTITYDGKLDDLDSNDMEDLMEHRYFKQIKKIESFCESPDLKQNISDLQGSIRIILEDSIKFRYRKYLKSEYTDTQGKKIGPLSNKEGLGSMINILEVSDCIFKGDKDSIIFQLRELNEFSMAPHHGSIESSHREENLTIDELITFLNQTLDVIYKKL
ncbi:AAA family ATPase [Bacillus wiedmannii]|uniref:AAA family ATPase n=1 Tax=Bacillus wiedmannii TaxID=1890302 RepID=UPI0007DB3FBC|nr:AAA family ATPase [Bacillus wiedmannii]OAK20815.1 hypothetical protein A6281_25500 [Bacillus wiedmannii]OAK23316.1 hypothetical protein A6282_25605 [Bacillus wiedmannii]